MMLLKKILLLNEVKDKVVFSVKNFNLILNKIDNLEKQIAEQNQELEILKKRNTLLERNNNIIIQDFSLLASSVSEIFYYLADECRDDDLPKKKITYH